MPTNTFFHLSDQKRERLIGAIKDEFSRVSFDKVSINKIIQAADISRGSFYQYFTGKDDMLGFILSEYRHTMLEHLKACLQANHGDLFGMFYDILDFTIGFVVNEHKNAFCKNLFADIKVSTDFYKNLPHSTAITEAIAELKPHVDFTMLDLREEDDFYNMSSVLLSICRDATAEVFLNVSDCEKAKQKYQQQLQLLKRGFQKNKE